MFSPTQNDQAEKIFLGIRNYCIVHSVLHFSV